MSTITTKLGRMVTNLKKLLFIKSMTLWSQGLSRLRDKLHSFCISYYNAYDHSNWQDSDLPRVASIRLVKRPYNHVILRDHVTNKNCYTSTTTMLMATKLGRVGLYNEELPSIIPKGPLITWFCKFTWKTRSIISPLPQSLLSPNLVRW